MSELFCCDHLIIQRVYKNLHFMGLFLGFC